MPSVQYVHPEHTSEGKKERRDAMTLSLALMAPMAILIGFGLVVAGLQATGVLPDPWVTPFFTARTG